jgi:hypothetical protein
LAAALGGDHGSSQSYDLQTAQRCAAELQRPDSTVVGAPSCFDGAPGGPLVRHITRLV